MSLADDLGRVVRGEVDASEKTREVYSRDASLYRIKPALVVRPQDADDVRALVKAVRTMRQNGENVSVTPRAAGTDMSGGPLTDSIVVDMASHMNRIGTVADETITTEPGVYFRDFDRVTKKHGLELPSYTASREICTVGGMAANNSGGEKNLKYGKTARYVRELDVVMADGEVHHLKNLEGAALTAKLGEQSFEGDVYRACSSILQKYKMIIEKAKPKVEKNSSGYALWDMGDGVTRIDLARLMVGAQGTLGIITKIKFALVRPKKFSAMTILMVDSLHELGSLVPSVLAYGPDSFESYDDNTLRLAVRYFPEFATQMGAGLVSLGIQFFPEVLMLLKGGVPKLVLLAEFRADTQGEALRKAEKLARDVRTHIPRVRVRVARNERASKKYWVIRRESFNLLRKKVRNLRTAPFIDDFVVPPLSLPVFLPKLIAILDRYKLLYTVAGHVGDGNFHIIPLIDPKNPDMVRVIHELSKEVYALVLRHHGSISGEHNDGLVRTPFVEQQFGPDMYQLFVEIKKIFDPMNIFNPNKKVGLTHGQAARHLDVVR